jgi:hypothetical protein
MGSNNPAPPLRSTLVFAKIKRGSERAKGIGGDHPGESGCTSLNAKEDLPMSTTVYRVLRVVCEVVAGLPVDTNRSPVDVCWMVLSGQLLSSRGGVIPGLAALGLPAPAVRRAWAALEQGAWSIGELIARWHQVVAQEGKWQARRHGGMGRWRRT